MELRSSLLKAWLKLREEGTNSFFFFFFFFPLFDSQLVNGACLISSISNNRLQRETFELLATCQALILHGVLVQLSVDVI